jgi:uncharacterized protein with FMN-binding domain
VIGYQGTTTLGIVLNNDYSINRVNIIKSQDTQAYIKKIDNSGFLKQLSGYIKGSEVQHVTMATKTCEAIIKSLDESVEKFTLIHKQ